MRIDILHACAAGREVMAFVHPISQKNIEAEERSGVMKEESADRVSGQVVFFVS